MPRVSLAVFSNIADFLRRHLVFPYIHIPPAFHLMIRWEQIDHQVAKTLGRPSCNYFQEIQNYIIKVYHRHRWSNRQTKRRTTYHSITVLYAPRRDKTQPCALQSYKANIVVLRLYLLIIVNCFMFFCVIAVVAAPSYEELFT